MILFAVAVQNVIDWAVYCCWALLTEEYGAGTEDEDGQGKAQNANILAKNAVTHGMKIGFKI